jgi:hypothetical protein
MNGGVVMLGMRTSTFTKQEFSDFIEFLYATAADRGVTVPDWDAITARDAANDSIPMEAAA